MIVLGIDPGAQRVGYGVVEKEGGEIKYLSAGILRVKNKGAGALPEIKTGVEKLVKKFKPKRIAVEKLYFSKNQKTALAVSEARGAVLLAALESGSEIKEYSPNEVKAGITGHGFADKPAVFKMVKLILKEPELKIIDDASDALAIAIMAAGIRS